MALPPKPTAAPRGSDTPVLTYEEYNEKIKNLKNVDDVHNFLRDLVAPTLQTMLDAELDHHLGYAKHDPSGRGSGNSRNGRYAKTLKTRAGTMTVDVPRDRNSTFTPAVVPKYETVDNGIEERIVSMYGKGMTTGDINAHMQDIYGVEVSKDTVSHITDKVLPLIHEWQNRPLAAIYPIVYLDAVHFKVRESGRIVSKAAYVMLGINILGRKEILGIWIGENEGAKFWLGLLNEVSNRGVEDIYIACIDGLSGFADAIHAVFPKAEIQRCIVHMVRNTAKYVSTKDQKRFCADLRTIYTAPTEAAGYEALQGVVARWPQYALYLKSWEQAWDELATFFAYPAEIRRIIYTTNAIEGLNRQFRKVTKTTVIFPHDTALLKLLWLAQGDITKKWTMPVANWGKIIAQFAIMFPERVPID
jgi:putative transposase